MVKGKVEGIFGIVRDITDLKKNEELIIKSEKLSIIGQLAAGVAHEVRNPLTSLKGFIQLLQTTKEVNDEHLEIMSAEIDRMNLIVSELLILGKQQAVHFQMKGLKDMLKHVSTLMETQAVLNDITITPHFDESNDYPLICEPNQIKQVFINIIKNAIESMPNGGKVNIEVLHDQNNVKVAVIDQGIGMERERIEHLGEPFYSTKEKGTGLGLMISYKIIERHHGKITIDSKKGKGTTVTVTLPLVK